ncbi:MAG TPA: FKBP-type peptidyl-prolyl cis-trans isomerase [Streptosporangiaceae bacterium]|nr:FKBP-type peptidyl-prolyl cis-trans isomerase [Streptosporangiaceae bacterium]
MRRIALTLLLPLLAVGLLAACGSSSSPSAASPAVTVTGTFGKAPTIKIPAEKASSTLTVKTLIHGTGPTLAKTDAFVGNYAIYIWSGTSHRLAQSSFTTHEPTLFAGQLLPGLEKALVGQKMGSRVLAVIPPKQAFGTSGNPQAGIKGTDTLVFVVDLIKNFPGNASASGKQVSTGGGTLPTVTATTAGAAPKIKMPSHKPPAKLVTKTLVMGSGPAIAKGQTVVVQYVGAIWRNAKVFDASWTRDQPFGFTIAASPSQVIPGWNTGLVGQTVGSRVMLVIPPADGYGKAGNSQAGIKGTDTLVFVVDILGAFS